MPETFDAIVIGGGVVGASVLFQLTRLGCRRALLLERGTVLPQRPRPFLDADNAAFWGGGADGALMVHRCRSCRTWFQPPAPVCRACQSLDVGPERPEVADAVVVRRVVLTADGPRQRRHHDRRDDADVTPPDAMAPESAPSKGDDRARPRHGSVRHLIG